VGGELTANADGFLVGIAGSAAADALVGAYRLEKQLGRGGMAAVYLARDERLDRLVALKIMAPALAADEAFRQRFIRESRAAAAVDDPHIIPVFEAGDADGVLYIAMRYVPGGDVGTIVHHDGPLSPGRAAAVILQVASALDAAHAAGLVHRDVKPANMLVDVRPGMPDHVYLSDFGLSKTVAFELLTGSPPFRYEEATAVMYAHLSQLPPSMSSRRPDIPTAVDQVFARALAKAPASRYSSCRAFAYELLRALYSAPHHNAPHRSHLQASGRMMSDHLATEIDWKSVRSVEQRRVPADGAPAGTRAD